MSAPKFVVVDGLIRLTPVGNSFVENVSTKQVTGTLKKIKKKEAYVWVDKFIKLSNKKAQASADFTPVNNLFKHLALCDELLQDLYLQPGEPADAVIANADKIPEKRKQMLLKELEGLRAKLRADSETLVSADSRKNFKIVIDFFDKALKETLDIN